jgi:2,4-dienoyl-CoA reductase-like NADH-dependent reductase (Old Yellow Enzyme family)
LVENVLFSPIEIRGLKLKNRVVVSPMCQYTAVDGYLNDWHVSHLNQFASGGAALILMEATAVEERGRITHGCSGLWSDSHMDGMKIVIEQVKKRGAAIGVQLGHAGRKASISRPWEGDCPLSEKEFAKGELNWEIVGPSAVPFSEGWLTPHELSINEISDVIDSWVHAAKRALKLGFDVIEIHSAHGYLSHSFLSPMSNTREDRYGGSLKNRTRFTLELAKAVRDVWPIDKPLFIRISAVDGKLDGWKISDSIYLAKSLKKIGIDVIDCSSGGISGYGENILPPPTPGYQVSHSSVIKEQVGIITQAVGLITEPAQAETILRCGSADLVSLARELLYNPYWVRHAAKILDQDKYFEDMPIQYSYWLEMRSKGMFGKRPGDSDTENL